MTEAALCLAPGISILTMSHGVGTTNIPSSDKKSQMIEGKWPSHNSCVHQVKLCPSLIWQTEQCAQVLGLHSTITKILCLLLPGFPFGNSKELSAETCPQHWEDLFFSWSSFLYVLVAPLHQIFIWKKIFHRSWKKNCYNDLCLSWHSLACCDSLCSLGLSTHGQVQFGLLKLFIRRTHSQYFCMDPERTDHLSSSYTHHEAQEISSWCNSI